MYSVILIPNHKDLNPTLIGLCENPLTFVVKWLHERPQFIMEKQGDKNVWKGWNKDSNWGANKNMLKAISTVTNKNYSREPEDSPYTITANKIVGDKTLNVTIDYYSDAFQYLS